MGLDITVFTEVKLVQDKTEEIECLWEWIDEKEGLDPQISLTVLEVNPYFPKQSKTLCYGGYKYKNSASVLSRSYSGWSNVREELAKASGYLPLDLTEGDREGLELHEISGLNSRPHQAQVFQQEGVFYTNLLTSLTVKA